MSRRLGFLVATAFLSVIGVSLAITTIRAAQRSPRATSKANSSPPRNDPRFAFPVAPTTMSLEQHAALAAARPVYTVDVYPLEQGAKRTEADQKVLEELSKRLAQQAPVPASRQAYFSWLDSADSPIRFYSWGCWLRAFKPIPGGWALEVWASPRAEDAWGNHIDVYNWFVEEYTLTKSGGLQFLRGYPHPTDKVGVPRFGRSGT